MSQQIEKGTLLLDEVTLTENYGVATASIDIGRKSEQIIVYTKWTSGQANARLYCKVQCSPTNELYFPTVHELIDPNGDSLLVEKVFYNLYSSGNQMINEEIGDIRSDVNNPGGRIKFDIIPTTSTTPVIRHNGTAFGTVTEVAADANFTAPASLAAGTVEWSLATGNLNFASADVTSYDAQTIKADYVTNVNLFRIPIPVRDRFVKISFKEFAGAGGTITAWIDSDWSARS